MKSNNGYYDYPKNKPSKDDYYLVSVSPTCIIDLGLPPSPLILIARYNPATVEWTAILGISSTGLGNIANEIISWRDLPQPKQTRE